MLKTFTTCLFIIFVGINSIYCYTLTDASGNSFSFENPPKIACVTPNVTETICALNSSHLLLGISRYCSYPKGFPESKKYEEILSKKPILGGFIDPDYEKILYLKPDLFVIPVTSSNSQAQKVQNLGIKVFYTYPDGIDSVEKNTLLLGKLLNQNELAQTLVKDFKNTLFDPQRISPEMRPRTVFLFGKMAAGSGSFVGELLNLSGFFNVADATKKAWPVLSREAVLTSNIEILILEAENKDSFEKIKNELSNDKIWASTPAMKNGDVYFVETDAVIRPSLRLKKAALAFKEIRNLYLKKNFKKD